ncbi:hormogonium polysaccharide secretion pseudopilin HpsC [Nostoc sp. 106C]|uniref:hormogonium polysaccharide secretion pseudopilin HpsC n=1 Tax=Nostoc sp. 106C TaxID=1932667 RepID=UPI000A395992|nr:hormogonium polysaccharide secretion pseudopilin HpsC [Nostoc sp. 106C]OUL21854.1 prepilin-type N-terminal cleavage/methylation domain-containing protein [Nostoc sp. 106C]
MRPIKWLLTNQLKYSGVRQKLNGFTLIELLVAMIIAVLVITPLLGFMVNILDNDRKEQAKANTEQEIKESLDYIARDMQQAVYIYDADGIAAIRSQLPKYTQKDQYFPVLVFWKRQFVSGGLTVASGTDDTFVYSLVAYYLIKDNNSTWSQAARIGRFQISNGYGQTDTDREDTRDPGFKMFDLSNEGDLKSKMNQWVKTNETYTQDILALVDYVDQTTIDTTTNPEPVCSTGQLVPKFSGTGDAVATDNVKTRGFYVCVDSANTVAEVYLRGNSLARLQTTNLNFDQSNQSRKIYFPQASIRVQGRGFVFTK